MYGVRQEDLMPAWACVALRLHFTQLRLHRIQLESNKSNESNSLTSLTSLAPLWCFHASTLPRFHHRAAASKVEA